jgi:hypothetical protein
MLLPLKEQDCILTFYQITTHIFKTLVKMGISENIFFHKILTNLKFK